MAIKDVTPCRRPQGNLLLKANKREIAEIGAAYSGRLSPAQP